MAGIIHIVEVAAILAVAYALGWGIGYFARKLYASRPVAVVPAVPAERIAAVTADPEPDALVKAPVIVPVTSEPPPSVPPLPAAASEPESPAQTSPTMAAEAAPAAVAPMPAPEAIAAPAAVEPAPVAVAPAPVLPVEPEKAPPPEPVAPKPAAATTVLPPMDIPAFEPPAPLRFDPIRSRSEPEPLPQPEPEPEPEPAVPFTAAPALRPGVAWSGEIRGRSAVPPPKPAAEPVAEVFTEPPVEVPVSMEFTETIAFVSDPEPAPVETVELDSSPVVMPVAEAIHSSPVDAPASVAATTSEPVETTTTPQVHDEDAAMRAIEGGWSRVKARAPQDTPELADVGAAVAAAQSAVEQVLAQAGIDAEASAGASRPEGLARPRAGRKDDLKRIEGLGSLDESTLNNLGVYHFDQIAGWSEAQVLWMENHVFARGRIGRESWQEQARGLVQASAG